MEGDIAGAENVFREDAESGGFAEEEETLIPDPIEKFNRAMFQFNDKLYFYALKPLAQGYSQMIPETVRGGVRNFFANLKYPVRLANNLLQGKWRGAAAETGRFVINTLGGGLGFMNHAKSHPVLRAPPEDFGQTLGRWGCPPGFYVVWPFLGPSSLRGTFGMAGDALLDPVGYAPDRKVYYAAGAAERLNAISLELGAYEAVKKAAMDPYLSIRHGYHTRRESMIRE